MKKRLHDKKAGIAILSALIIISLAEVIFRAVVMGLEAILTTSNLGEQLAVIALATTILILSAKGKDKACYICYGAWAGYFVLDQLFELPGMVATLMSNNSRPIVALSIVIRLLTMVCIIAIGVLLVEYMTDGTIYNRAFNAFCLITILLLAVSIFWAIYQLIFASVEGVQNIVIKKQNVLVIFNNVYRLIMIFLFTFFAYDSAKHQLKKTDLTK
jgi:hypothetical protein